VVYVRAESILVPFRGEGSGTAELTWGQWHNWPKMRDYPSVFNMGGAMPCPPDTTIADFVDIVKFMMGNHQALRTRLAYDTDGTPRQIVAESGRLPLEIVAVADDEDPAAVAHQIETRYQNTAFDFEIEWPVRMAVVRQHGKSTHSIVMVSHLAVDAHSLDLLAAGFADRADRVADDLVTAPLAQARGQRAKSGQRASAAALRSWERLLRDVPADRFGGCGDPRRPRYWQGAYRSPAGYLAVRAIAARDQTDTAPVVLAAIAVSLARITRNPLTVWQLVVSNRFRPGLATAVGPVSQTGLCTIDLTGIGFREAVTRARGAILAAGMNGYYDPRQRDELIAGLRRDIDITCVVNDRRRPNLDPPPDVPPTAAEITAATGQGELRWDFTTDRPSDHFYVHVNQVPEALDYAICADTHHLGVDDLVACLRGVEAVLVEAALDPDAVTGITRPPP
jgi:hypothetical protein